MSTPAPTTPAPTTLPTTYFTPDEAPDPPVVLPTACIVRILPTQVRNAIQIEWELSWPEGSLPDPEEIRQYIERSEFPEGPFKRVGMVPGPRDFFVDVSADLATFTKQWYYRIRCRRVRR